VAVDAGKSFNAALSAVQILSRAHPELVERLETYHDALQDGVGDDSMGLHTKGTERYREEME